MLFIYSLIVLAAVTALIFAVPLRAKVWAALAVVVLAALWASAKAAGVLAGGGTAQLWQLPGNFYGGDSGSMDALSALFILIISVGGVATTLYSHGYLARYLAEKSSTHLSIHYTSLTVMFLSLLGVVCSDGGYSFLFAWELMTIASFLLILFHAERREVRRAAISYLILMHVGFVLLLAGFVQLNQACGSASFSALSDYLSAQPALPLLLLFLLGFGMKAGLFPMHVWLPEAYSAAPSHVPALMSGVMSKMGIYGILRVVSFIPDLPTLQLMGAILLAAGIVTALWGAILAAAQNDIKRLLAYSSIENIGIIVLGIGVAALGKASGNHLMALCGIAGALLHVVNHSFFKALLFFGAGNVLSKTHTTSLDALGGLSKHMPITSLLFLLGSMAICALPPLNGFVSELLIYLGLFDGIASGTDPLAAAAGIGALALTGGVVVLAFTKLYGVVFLGAPRTHEVAESEEVDNLRIAAMALPLTGMLFVGLFPQSAVCIITRATGFFLRTPADAADYLLSPTLVAVSRTAWLLILLAGLLAWLRQRTLAKRTVAKGTTWGCGFTAPNVRMQYTGESYSEGLQSIAGKITRDSGAGRAVDKSEIFPAPHNFDLHHRDRVARLFNLWWVELLRQVNQRVMRLRTGKINHYILFALVFLALVLLLSLFNLL